MTDSELTKMEALVALDKQLLAEVGDGGEFVNPAVIERVLKVDVRLANLRTLERLRGLTATSPTSAECRAPDVHASRSSRKSAKATSGTGRSRRASSSTTKRRSSRKI